MMPASNYPFMIHVISRLDGLPIELMRQILMDVGLLIGKLNE
jgi:hypothetical protein